MPCCYYSAPIIIAAAPPPLPTPSIWLTANCYSDVLRRSARLVLPWRVARVTGVSPRAFFACIEAPQRTKNLASSSFGCYPQHKCKAVSPLAFLTSIWASLRPLRNLTSYRLLLLVAWCSKELSEFSLSLKLNISAPCYSICCKRSKSPLSAACLAEACEPFICSRWSTISDLAIGIWQ